MTIVTRFAPSPTGYLHVGGARTALFAWLLARQQGGRFVLRIEDTDRERSTAESVDAIVQGLQWLGLDWDEGPIYQSERGDRYGQVIEQLLATDNAYRCYCGKAELDAARQTAMARGEKPKYNGKCRDRAGPPPAGVAPVIRFKNPRQGEVVFDDLIKGRIAIDNNELDDLIIARPDGTPTYNLTVVVDDRDMGITHVVRGDDHVNNTPRQINILRALHARPPIYAHVPMILGDDGKRLSKRHGAVGVTQYADEGYLPPAMLNHLVRLGWSHGDEEIFSKREMLEKFSLDHINRAAAAFNGEKLQWFNQHYIRQADTDLLARDLRRRLDRQGIATAPGPDLGEVADVLRERARTLAEMAQKAAIFYRDFDTFDAKVAAKNLKPAIAEPLRALRDRLREIKDWRPRAIEEAVAETAAQFGLKLGKLGQPTRVAVTGSGVSPPIDQTIYLIGRARALRGLERALDYIEKANP